MRVLFIHQNFPGQFKHLAPALAGRGHQVVAPTMNLPPQMPGVQVIPYGVKRGTSPNIHPWVSEFETKVIRGEACGMAMIKLREQGFVPDVIVAHPGWGEALFAKDVFPESPLLAYIEFYYATRGLDVGFDQEFQKKSFEEDARLRCKNAYNLLTLEAMDAGLLPTWWQRSTVPVHYQDKISVIFDGVDTDAVRPDPGATLTLQRPDGERVVRAGDEIITFVSRNLEPYRGYHIFMRALPEIMRRRQNAIALIVGGDKVSYGAKAPDGTTWKEVFFNEVKDRLDLSRLFFLGNVPYQVFLGLLQVSACHVYLTYPFVLSWSYIEAMSAGCLVAGSRTPPVEEVVEHERNGLLVDFFDVEGLADRVVDCLENPGHYRPLRTRARETAIECYDLKRVCLPRQMQLVENIES
ncbi:MAG: glycosyltransferase family 4 protein [Candidatus Latescibacterota bacterium]